MDRKIPHMEYLISLLDGSSQVNLKEFLLLFSTSVKDNPESIADFIKAYNCFLLKEMPFEKSEAAQITLESVAALSIMADYTDMQEGLCIANVNINYYNHPKDYGPAMKAVAKYVGLEGPNLKRFIFEGNSTVH